MAKSNLPVHPAAAVFPMMTDDELKSLAADIKQNGLLHPIVLDSEGKTLIEGRNRLAACQIAGVEPRFERLNGTDPTAFIISSNIARRHMSKGQQAMAVAMIYPEPSERGRGKKDSKIESFCVHPGSLSNARTVLASDPDLAQDVLNGDKPLIDAYRTVQARKGDLQNERGRMRKLRDERPDLADKVADAKLELEEAEAEAKKDADELKQQRWAATTNLIDAVIPLDRPAESGAEMAAQFDHGVAASRGEQMTPKRIRRAAAFLEQVAISMEKINAKNAK